MKKLIFVFLNLCFFTVSALAQNPIIRNLYSADPSALVVGDRVYVYPSHDIFPPEEYPRKDWFCMEDYHVFSSSDLINWTDHGMILNQNSAPWINNTSFSMWAPDCKEHNGTYYFYYPALRKTVEGQKFGGFGIGVATSKTPAGPFVAEPTPIEGPMGIDPCIFKDDDGTGYLVWPQRGFVIAKLNDDWKTLSGERHVVENTPTKGLIEGPYLFKRDGWYYMTFPWARENTEVLAYCMSRNIFGPYEFKGVFFEEWPNGCWTNHHSIIQFKDQWYLFYHHNDFSPRDDKRRSVCCDSISFNPDGTIKMVKPTLRGVGITDGREQVQIDRYSEIGGGATIAYNDTTNYFQGWKVILPPNAWVTYNKVRIENPNAKVWVNMPGRFGRSQLRAIDGSGLELQRIPVSGMADVYDIKLINKGNMPAEVDWVSISDRMPVAPWTQGGMVTGMYRNMFVEAGHSEAEVEAKLKEVFSDVFEGKNKCYFEVGKDMAYMMDIKNNDVRTEGMSYGMMIAVQFDRQDIFNRLWRWAKKYMQMQDGPMKGYFRWSCKTDGKPNAQGPASDGELYFITSLIFASNLWGNTGEINYLKEAQYILDCCQPKEITVDMNGRRPKSPDGKEIKGPVKRTVSLIDDKTKLISFTPGTPFTDPSYHLPAFYEVWARYAEDGRAAYWRECAAKSREYLHKSMNPITALNPDCNNFDGSIMQGGFLGGDVFRYDSWRVPMNIALDYSWACADAKWQQNYANMIQDFFYSQGLTTFVDQYKVDGTRPERILKAGNYPEKLRHSIGLVGTTAAISLAASHAKSYEFIEQLWNMKHEPDADGYFDAYYDGLLRLFAFMHLSGHYRAIEKTPQFNTYFAPSAATAATPDDDGFIRRWSILEPMSKPNRSNTVFTDSYIRDAFAKDAPNPFPTHPKNGEVSNIGGQKLAWHKLDSNLFNVKLFRFASTQKLQIYGVLFWVETEIENEQDLEDVRLAVGSNSASMWWIDDKEALILSGDRRMVKDDCISQRLSLKAGKHILKGAVINGPGMSDFCLRFLDEKGMPVKGYKIW